MEDFKVFFKFVLFVVLTLVVLVVMGLGLFGVRVFLAEVIGRGEKHIEVESGPYRMTMYDSFFNQCASIQGLEGQIDVLEETLSYQTPGTREYNITVTNLAGVRGMRRTAIAQYNQDALKNSTAGQFRDVNLPFQIVNAEYYGEMTQCAVQ